MTQNAEQQRYPAGWRQLVLLLVTIAILLGSIEVSTRLFIRRVGRIEGRIGTEYAQMLAAPKSARPVVAWVGNSLLFAAVDFPALQAGVGSQMEARRWTVEGTAYHDWRYGIRKLFSAGAKPRVLILTMNGKQLVSEASRGDYAAQVMVARGDLWHFVQDLNVHPTNASNMVFGNFSMFYAMRSEIRKFVMGRILPELPLLFVPAIVNEVAAAELERTAQQRIEILGEECARAGVRLVFALVPSLSHESVREFQRAIQKTGVEVMVPFGPGDFRPEEFSDGFHLNREGARHYTRLMEEALLRPEWLSTPSRR